MNFDSGSRNHGADTGKLNLMSLFPVFVLAAGTAAGIAGFAFWMAAINAPRKKAMGPGAMNMTTPGVGESITAGGGGTESSAPRILNGKTLYQQNCSACHGPDLKGVATPGAIPVPSLGNPDFLSVASDNYLRKLIHTGRSGTAMPAWGKDHGGVLEDDQIDALVAFIRSHEPKGPRLEDISREKGNPRFGAALYRGNCAICHGTRGEGGIGTALRSPGFLELASDRNIVHTIVNGRPDTGMPSWRKMTAQQVSDILAYLRSWQGPKVEVSEVRAYLDSGKASSRMGARIYRSKCQACHGRKAEGAIGPSLVHEEFLAIVDDEYLIRAIRDGRPGTAMPTWTEFGVEDLGDLVAFLRKKGGKITRRTPRPPQGGDAVRGKDIYRSACLSCHGMKGTGGVGPQLANPVFLEQASDAFLAETIRVGRNGTAMRGFLRHARKGGAGGIVDLDEKQIADVVAYVRSFQNEPLDMTAMRAVLGNAHRGKDIYEKTAGCAQCHGKFGEGDVGPALGNPFFLEQVSEGFLIGTMVLGRKGTEMRSFVRGGISRLSASDLMDVAAYVRTLPFHLPKGPKGWRHHKPTGPIEVGRKLYDSNCMGCHGKDGKGGYAPTLTNPEFLSAASDGFLVATIARGRQTTQMRGFGPGTPGIATLSADEIRSIIGFIRSFQKGSR